MNKLSIIFISLVILQLLSCNRDEEKNNLVFTGKVIDEVTKQPVSGADVFYAFRPFCEFQEALIPIGQTRSGIDGSYKGYISRDRLTTLKDCEIQFNYALKDGYAGSSIVSPSGGIIEMYHFSELELHVSNDPLNNQTDKLEIWITGNEKFFSYPGFREKIIPGFGPSYTIGCEGKDFDKVFVLKLWGNLKYTVGGGTNYITGPYFFSYGVSLLPDSVKLLDITF